MIRAQGWSTLYMQFSQQMFLLTLLPEVMIRFPGAELERGCWQESSSAFGKARF